MDRNTFNTAKARIDTVKTAIISAATMIYNWIFNVQMVTVSNRDVHGFNVYEYQASPTRGRKEYLVTFRHTRNGLQVHYWAARMPAQDWLATKERLIESGRYAY
jgi:hypothetical protein